jgi:hypothetical protein
MPTPRATLPPADVASEVGSLSAGLGIITMTLFPFALPGLVLLAPVALIPLAGLLLAAPVLLPLWLVRRLRRALSRRHVPARRVALST